MLPLSFTLDTPGPMARSVEDAALLFRLLNGPARATPRPCSGPPPIRCPTLRRGVSGLRIAVMPEAERAGVDQSVLAAFDASADALARLGAQIVRASLPHRFSDYAAATGRIIGAEGYRFVDQLVDEPVTPAPMIRPVAAA